MLDIQFIRDNAELVKQKSQQKGYDVDVSKLLEVDSHRRDLIRQCEALRAQINKASDEFKNQPPNEQQRNELKAVKDRLNELEDQLKNSESDFLSITRNIPNIFPDDTPIGDESASAEVEKWGNTEPKDFEIKDHQTWGEEHGLLDFERGAKVAGNKFYFTLGGLVELEQAVIQLGLQIAQKHGFKPVTVPHLVNRRTIEGTGFLAKGEEEQIYKTEDEDLHLIATAEIPITGFHGDEILNIKDAPKLYVGLSPAYRREAGAYGKHSRGLYRVHQFNKLEMYVFCTPEQSEEWHQKLIDIEKEICQQLEIPYRLIRIASGDLGAPAYKKFDIEYYSPVDKAYRELMSCSNVTDYQARRLNIRYRDDHGNPAYVHTLNGTAAAFSRICIAMIENHQQSDGQLRVPVSLRGYIGGKEFIS